MGGASAKPLDDDVCREQDLAACCSVAALRAAEPRRRPPRQRPDDAAEDPVTTQPRPSAAEPAGELEPQSTPASPQPAPLQAAPAPPQPAPPRAIGDVRAAPPRYVAPRLPNVVATSAGVEHIEPEQVQALLRAGACLLVDVRGGDRNTGWIEGAVHVPAIDTVPFLTKVPELAQRWADEQLVVFHCQYSAHRAPQCANWYRERASPSQRVGILSGGFRAWEGWGFPCQRPAPVGAAAAGVGGDAAAADAYAIRQGLQIARQAAAAQADPEARAHPPAALPPQAAQAAFGAPPGGPAQPLHAQPLWPPRLLHCQAGGAEGQALKQPALAAAHALAAPGAVPVAHLGG